MEYPLPNFIKEDVKNIIADYMLAKQC